jgi:hypothetical protein
LLPLTARLWEADANEPRERSRRYGEALEDLDTAITGPAAPQRTTRAYIEALLTLVAVDITSGHAKSAEGNVLIAVALTERLLAADPEDPQTRRTMARALRRLAWLHSANGNLGESDAVRKRELANLAYPRTETPPDTADRPVESVGTPLPPSRGGCEETAERLSAGESQVALQPDHLLIADHNAGDGRGALLLFSPKTKALSILATGGYFSDLRDAALGSNGEIYALDGNLARGKGGVIRLVFRSGRWAQKPVSCGGLLAGPVSLAFHDRHLIVAGFDGHRTRFIAIDPATGNQTVLGASREGAQPGKVVAGPGSDLYVGLFSSAEGGPAEIVRLNASTGSQTTVTQLGLLEDPVALAVATDKDSMLVGDRN